MGASWVGDSTLDYDEKYIEAVDDEEEMKVMMMTRYDKCEHTTGLPPPALPLTPHKFSPSFPSPAHLLTLSAHGPPPKFPHIFPPASSKECRKELPPLVPPTHTHLTPVKKVSLGLQTS